MLIKPGKPHRPDNPQLRVISMQTDENRHLPAHGGGFKLHGEVETEQRNFMPHGNMNWGIDLRIAGISRKNGIIEHLDEGAGPLGLLVLELDHFKDINETWGDDAGDAALRHFVGLIKGELRNNDLFGCLGDKEFALLMPETDIGGAWTLGERIRRVVAETPLVTESGEEISLTVSGGAPSERPASPWARPCSVAAAPFIRPGRTGETA